MYFFDSNTKSKLAVANWYWRPGVFFFTFTCGNEIIAIADMVLSNDSAQQNCLQRLSRAHTSIIIVAEMCSIQSKLNQIVMLGALIRDTLTCVRDLVHF